MKPEERIDELENALRALQQRIQIIGGISLFSFMMVVYFMFS